MEWTADNQIILEHMNRLQNTNTVFLANPDTGALRQMFQDKDDTWVEVNRNLRWIEGGKRLLFTSERDGWRHLYAVSREGDARLITSAPFDMVSLAAVDEPGGWVYYIASPDNATQRYLYRARLDGTKTERITPANQPGTHTYNISPDCHWAFHSVSTFDSPGRIRPDQSARPQSGASDERQCRVEGEDRADSGGTHRDGPHSGGSRYDHRWLADPPE